MSKTIIKRVGKSFRLIDFHIFNQKGELFNKDDELSDDSDEQTKWNQPENFIIQMFGINEKGETCCIYLNDYKPFFYIRIGDHWDEDDVFELKRDIQQKLGKYYGQFVRSIELVDHHKLYGFISGKNRCSTVK